MKSIMLKKLSVVVLCLFGTSMALPQHSSVHCLTVISPPDRDCTAVMSPDECSLIAQNCKGVCYGPDVTDHRKAKPIECPSEYSTPLQPSSPPSSPPSAYSTTDETKQEKRIAIPPPVCRIVCLLDSHCGTYEFDRSQLRCGCPCQACPSPPKPNKVAKKGDVTAVYGATNNYLEAKALTKDEVLECPHIKYPSIDDDGHEKINWPKKKKH